MKITVSELFELLSRFGLVLPAETAVPEPELDLDENNDDEVEMTAKARRLADAEIYGNVGSASDEAEEAERIRNEERQRLIAAAKDVLNGTRPAGPGGLATILVEFDWTFEEIARMLDVDVSGIAALFKGECYPFVEQAFIRDFPPTGNVSDPKANSAKLKELFPPEDAESNGTLGKMSPKKRLGRRGFTPSEPADLSACKSVKEAAEALVAHWNGKAAALAKRANLDYNQLRKALKTGQTSPKIMAYLVENKFDLKYAEGKE